MFFRKSLFALVVVVACNLFGLGQEHNLGATQKTYGNLPMSFEGNMGQTDPQVKFFAREQGTLLYFTDKEAVFNLAARRAPNSQEAAKGDILRFGLVGAESRRVLGEGLLPGKVNYLQSSAGRPIADVPTFSAVRYEAAYPGIDVTYHGAQRRLEYDFHVAPLADPNNIRLKIEGAAALRLLPNGDLEITGKYGSIRWDKPVAYQEYLDRGRVKIAARYVLDGNTVSFRVGPYNHNGLLIIDPTLVYSTYVGGNDATACCSSVNDIAVDDLGFAYIAGVTVQSDFPVTVGAYDTRVRIGGFVSKLNQDATALVYSTYLTGNSGPTGIAVDDAGNLYVTGTAAADQPFTSPAPNPNFQTTPGAFRNMGTRFGAAFVLKLNPAGSQVIYSTVIGHLANGGTTKIALNTRSAAANPQAYITGFVEGNPDFPITSGAFQPAPSNSLTTLDDAFVTCVNGDGSNLCYSTYLGGKANQAKFTNLTGDSSGNAIVVRPNGDAVITGNTRSDAFPATNTKYAQIYTTGNTDIFVTELNATGTGLVFSSIVGGPYDDRANAIVLDGTGNAYVGGGTDGGNFPTLANSYRKFSNNTQDGIVFELSADGQTLLGSTFLGGSVRDEVSGIAFDGTNVHIAGTTSSGDFPVTADAFQSAFVGTPPNSANAFYSKLDGGLSALLYSTYFNNSGATAIKPAATGDGTTANALALDSGGNVYISGIANAGLSVSGNAYKKENITRFQISYVAKLSAATGVSTCSTINLTVPAPAQNFAGPSPVNFQAVAAAASGCPITAIQIYQDNVLIFQTANATLDTNLAVPPGQHLMVIQAWNTAGTIAKVARNISVTTGGVGGNCTAAAQSVNLCIPVAAAVVASPVEISGAANIVNRTLLRAYLDNVVLFETGAASFDQPFAVTSGTHHLTLVGYNNAGAAFTQGLAFTVSGAPAGCGQPTATATVVICAPAANAAVASPFQLDARARWDGFVITHMRAYMDNQPVYDQDNPPNGEITPTLPASAGTHRIVVIAWNSGGQSITSPPLNITAP